MIPRRTFAEEGSVLRKHTRSAGPCEVLERIVVVGALAQHERAERDQGLIPLPPAPALIREDAVPGDEHGGTAAVPCRDERTGACRRRRKR